MEVPRHWRLKKQRYSLIGVTCPSCKSNIFPPRDVCPYCAEAKAEAAYQKQEPVLQFAGAVETSVR